MTRFPRFSRAIIQRLIRQGAVQVNGERAKASCHVERGDRIRLTLPILPHDELVAEDIPLDVVYEDPFMVVVNKPPNMVVHPSRGHRRGTLVNALQFHFDRLSRKGGLLRPGIVHRLDRDTSGLILVAKDELSHTDLAAQFERRTIEKTYSAILVGELDRDSDYIERQIGVHPTDRTKMAIRRDEGKSASSFYQVVERFQGYTYVEVHPTTGRTHQIRVHLASIGCPVLADHRYGGRRAVRLSDLTELAPGQQDRVLVSRQCLHAQRLALQHPRTHKPLELEAPLPEDFVRILNALRANRRRSAGGERPAGNGA